LDSVDSTSTVEMKELQHFFEEIASKEQSVFDSNPDPSPALRQSGNIVLTDYSGTPK
jgi:hypothetical protein